MSSRSASYLSAAVICLLILAIIKCHAQIAESQKRAVLDVFNQARRTTVVSAANMKEIKWDDSLAAEAQAFTNVCQPPGATHGKEVAGGWLAYWDHIRAPDPAGVASWRTLRMAPFYDYEVRFR
jgi:hypothetical protein